MRLGDGGLSPIVARVDTERMELIFAKTSLLVVSRGTMLDETTCPHPGFPPSLALGTLPRAHNRP